MEPPHKLPSKAGWHEDEAGRPIQVAVEPRQFRTPEKRVPIDNWPFRSTWVLKNQKWTQLEDRVRYKTLDDPRAPIKGCIEKGIFRFESEFKAAPSPVGSVHDAPGTNMISKSSTLLPVVTPGRGALATPLSVLVPGRERRSWGGRSPSPLASLRYQEEKSENSVVSLMGLLNPFPSLSTMTMTSAVHLIPIATTTAALRAVPRRQTGTGGRRLEDSSDLPKTCVPRGQLP